MSLHQLEEYQSKITDTNSRLADQLQNVSHRPMMRQEEQEKIKEVEDAILRCIEACRKAGSAIERVRRESFGICMRRGPEKSVMSRRIWQMTDKDLNSVREYLSTRELKLLEMK